MKQCDDFSLNEVINIVFLEPKPSNYWMKCDLTVRPKVLSFFKEWEAVGILRGNKNNFLLM